jgi:TM2 domain-containing membrane protein YozV
VTNKAICLTGTVIGLAIAILGAIGMLAGYIPRLYSGFIAVAAIGIISGTRRMALRRRAGN